MGMSGGGGGGLQSEINVTPMVDIMLVLLIIFMVVTPFLQQGVTVALPKNMENPEVDPAIIKESSVVISIPNDGEVYINKDKITDFTSDEKHKSELQTRIDKMLASKTDAERIVYIKSGVGVNYGSVVGVINEVRKAGVDKIGLVADKKKKGGTEPAA
ncbi:MAG TPA: biopolymer transporter ExbD [Pyrinomonadaceae bacterium]|jgi:biopolymer transport protein ExbD